MEEERQWNEWRKKVVLIRFFSPIILFTITLSAILFSTAFSYPHLAETILMSLATLLCVAIFRHGRIFLFVSISMSISLWLCCARLH
jgi:hypothetical protein